MKKFLFLASLLLFTMVMYASPPPDLLPDIVTGQSAYVVQVNAVISTPVNFEVQEVTFIYLGDFELFVCAELIVDPENAIQFPKMLVVNTGYNKLSELQKPPSFYINVGVSHCSSGFQRNLQNTNYGYPLTADNC